MSRVRELLVTKGGTVIWFLALAVIVGYQIYDPSKRFIEAVVGIVFVTLVARFPLVWSLSFFIVLFPFPFALKVGTSNVVFIPIMIIIWFIRVSLGSVRRPIRSMLDWTIVLMTISYIFSFYNNPGGESLRLALLYFFMYLTAVGLFYLIVNFVRDSKTLERVMKAELVSCFLVAIFCVLEMLFPGRVLVEGWLSTPHKQALVMKDVRIEGPFRDFELLAEYAMLNIPIILLFFVRLKRMLFRFALFLLLILYVGLLMATSTRGAFISLFIGAIYMLILVRRDLNIVRITYVVVIALALFSVSEVIISKYTISGGMIKRLMTTKFVRGYIPETRAEAWPKAFERAKEHIIIGHSPVWDYSRKLGKWVWPHNAYLFYMNITGLFGLFTFLLLLYKLLKASIKTRADSMFSPSFAKALMLILHIDLVMFMIDQIKIDYPRSLTYLYFVWFLFGLIVAAYNVIQNENRTVMSETYQPGTGF